MYDPISTAVDFFAKILAAVVGAAVSRWLAQRPQLPAAPPQAMPRKQRRSRR